MLFTNKFKTYIFDCDGVIFDSNSLKIEAMRQSLINVLGNVNVISDCIDYFKNNFGKSRFHHVNIFLDEYIYIDEDEREIIRKDILSSYSNSCKELYLMANITPGFLKMINNICGEKYVASGSEQEELRWVFTQRKLDRYFSDIYGSPMAKSDIVKKIIAAGSDPRECVLLGDAISDINAAVTNGIQFIGYLPYSNVKQELMALCLQHKLPVLEYWE
ncbi:MULTISPECIES: HAD family hydrolase [Symbiopectobacterium]|uniref:HAD family hydrolase n=1 Tax=Symbiopectobacterium TaxID=801 RepID=UPI001A2B8610|nr:MULTISPECIES: HAD hydrolase-like protein [Symbiopectobacterium]MBG6247611.1 HAD family phosphatase [Candidatus Symbiopectobacterium sp. PLON1]MBT9429732.1 HAD family phosphatase [Candidatus Symbiopectobacterium endolongispinus]